ncbi:MAG: hypothetical protein ACKO6N_06565 [Myxococcota bacterium]
MWTQEPAPFAPEDDALLEQLADKVMRYGMAVPAIFFLESVKPLNFVGSQVMLFMGPLVTAFFPGAAYQRLSELLERRDTLEALIRKLERKLDEASHPPTGHPKSQP